MTIPVSPVSSCSATSAFLNNWGRRWALRKTLQEGRAANSLDVVQCKQPTYEKCHYGGNIGNWSLETACRALGVAWAFANKREKTAQ
jgi:hypothetical protein